MKSRPKLKYNAVAPDVDSENLQQERHLDAVWFFYFIIRFSFVTDWLV